MRLVRGTKDLYPEDYSLFKKIICKAVKVGKLFGFEQVATPIIEYGEVFNRSLGDTSDVVSKEMYSFDDRGGDTITLRPEFTAAMVRSVITEGQTHNMPLRFFTYGPLFRYERPQAGRQRQFHQINFEIFGDKSISADADVISLATMILKELDIYNLTTLELNSLGCSDSRNNYHTALVEYFKKYEKELSEDSLKRLEKNPLRILDSKDENDKKINENAPKMSEYYTLESAKRFDDLKNYLTKLGVDFIWNERLVRGLDYYSHTAFEFTTTELGAQGTVIGGGRYDSLAKIMSGKHDFPGIGLGGGVERLMLLLKDKHKYERRNIAIIPVGSEEVEYSLILAQKLRSDKIPVVIFETGKLAKKIEKAESSGCKAAIFVGQDEISKSRFGFKNLETGEKIDIELELLSKKCSEII